MRKFLAVLLAVAILGVAGAAFAVEAGHVTPGKSDSGNKVVVNSTAVKAKADLVAKDAVKFEGTGVEVTAVDATAASKDVEDYAAKGYVVAAVAPTLKVTATVEEISMDISFNDSYVGQKVSADLRKQVTSSVALAGGSTYYFVSNDVTKSTDVVPSNKTLTLVVKNPAEGTYKPIVTIAATKAINGVTEELNVNSDAFDKISNDLGGVPTVIPATAWKAATSSDKAATDKKAVLVFGKLTFGNTGPFMTEKTSFTSFYNSAKSGSAISADIDSAYVSTAAATFDKKAVYDSNGDKKTTVFTGDGYVGFVVTAVDNSEHTVAVVADAKEERQDGKTSSKGSGGCNGGFAGIAVLALGLAALRRKAR